jgi:hypothetical protein
MATKCCRSLRLLWTREAEGKNFEAKYLKSVRAFAGVRSLFEDIKGGGGKTHLPPIAGVRC